VGLKRGPLSLVSINEELLETKNQETYHWIISPLKYIHVILFTHSTYVQIVNLLNKEKKQKQKIAAPPRKLRLMAVGDSPH
jgi:hypothetical protein